MTPLKKYIRPGVLRNFLRKAHVLVGGKCPLAISYEGEVVIVEGAESFEGFGEDDPGVISSPIYFDEIHSGLLSVRMQPGCDSVDRNECERLLGFVVYSIQELIDMERARRSLADEALSKYRELALLHRSVPKINTSLHMRDVVNALIDECRLENYPGELGMIFLMDPTSMNYQLAAQFGFPLSVNLRAMASSNLFHAVASSGKGEIVNNLSRDPRWSDGVRGMGSLAIVPIISPNRCEGVLVLASENTGVFEAAHLRNLTTLASVAGLSVSNAFNFEGVQRLMNAILQALAEAIDSRDPYTAGHSERVAHLGVAFAQAMNENGGHEDRMFSNEDLREIYYAGILHDVGKIGIKEEVLTKNTRLSKPRLDVVRARFQLMGEFGDFDWVQAFERVTAVNKAMTPSEEDLLFIKSLGKQVLHGSENDIPLLYEEELEHLLLTYGNLTQDERREIQRHPAESERILQHIPMHENYSNMLTIIRQHHERMDGSGYPDQLRGDEILIQSRMMAIVDIYDAVTQDRHYKPAFTRSEAVKILNLEVEEGKLDVDLATFFLENLEYIEALSERVKVTRISHLSELSECASL
ncbi:HD domain-containing phosphohydrolase [Pseudodesulfovibrio sediminis]|nr:HD domain-containing phosphohydrolase [Pseudodesulfovibrio sediminis]